MAKTILEKESGKKYTINELKSFRDDAIKHLDVYRLQNVNYLMAKYAKKYRIDYYTL